jgi:hypothetical protein
MKTWINRLTLLVSVVAIVAIAVNGTSLAAPKTPRRQVACKIVNNPPSVPCGQFYNLIRVCPANGSWVVIGRRQNIC